MSAEAIKPSPKKIVVDGFLDDPYTAYRQFLAEGSIHFVDIGTGLQAAFSYPLVYSLLRDPRFSSKRTGAFMRAIPEEYRSNYSILVKMLGLWLLFMDPPEHSRLRKLMNKGFSPAVAELLRPRIEAIADEMLDALTDESEIEFMSQFAHPLPVKVIAHLLDIPESMHKDLIRWSDAIAIMIGNPQRTLEQCTAAQDALLSLTEFFRGVVAKRRSNPGTDLISLLLQIEADGEMLTEDELYAQCAMLLFGGHETTRNLIGNGIYTLLQYPDELQRLCAKPDLIRSCVEELLRYQSPVQFITRLAKEDLEIEGTNVCAGEPILLMLGAANRDPKQFGNPDIFDPTRANNSHLAFGAGPHFCIGNQIARLEAQTAILKLAQRFPKMSFANKRPQWAPNYALRGFKSFPLNLR
ncbi:hypothetical protein HNQ77_005350 [Silvibacterium bohemicum]|uniref:Cytochrome n=1 Tax=Silvibacterium bohemicum TaxID=1577686 RepID=A0A841KAL9_9BACT|nr:cytochrome P450 [Silvibacterium bohemicum]MBB6147354.1 hypothetical protein [Silvibacterium bohemicum]